MFKGTQRLPGRSISPRGAAGPLSDFHNSAGPRGLPGRPQAGALRAAPLIVMLYGAGQPAWMSAFPVEGN